MGIYKLFSGILLQKKWKHIRDRYARDVKERKGKSGQGSTKKIPYIYGKFLTFLDNTIMAKKTVSSLEDDAEEAAAAVSNVSASTSKETEVNVGKKRKIDPVEEQILEALRTNKTRREQQEKMEDNEDRHFLLSLLPSLMQIPPNLKLNARMDIMQCIKNYINTSDNATRYPYNSPYSQNVSPYTTNTPLLSPTESVYSIISTFTDDTQN